MNGEAPAPKEGWAVPARAPLLAALAVIATLVVAVFILGDVYDHDLRQRTQPPVIRFPAPELERVQTPPGQQHADYRQPAPERIDAAMAATASEGDALWQGAKP